MPSRVKVFANDGTELLEARLKDPEFLMSPRLAQESLERCQRHIDACADPDGLRVVVTLTSQAGGPYDGCAEGRMNPGLIWHLGRANKWYFRDLLREYCSIESDLSYEGWDFPFAPDRDDRKVI